MKRQITFILLCLFAGGANPQGRRTEAPLPDWQKAAGGTMSFDVASVREDKNPFKPPSFPLSADASFREPNGRFHADFGLPIYIEFAYKIDLTSGEMTAILEKLSAWVASDRFAIEAVAPLHATKDQYRLMMQHLLADRFHLQLHFEQKETPVLAMVLVKPGQPGPRLKPHSLGPSCDAKPEPDTFPQTCDVYAARPGKDGLTLFGARATTMALLAGNLGNLGGPSGEINRPVVDQTGLTSLWDYTMEIVPPWAAKPQNDSAPGTTLLEGVRDQLGIRLQSARAVVSLPVIDHLERPSDN